MVQNDFAFRENLEHLAPPCATAMSTSNGRSGGELLGVRAPDGHLHAFAQMFEERTALCVQRAEAADECYRKGARCGANMGKHRRIERETAEPGSDAFALEIPDIGRERGEDQIVCAVIELRHDERIGLR